MIIRPIQSARVVMCHGIHVMSYVMSSPSLFHVDIRPFIPTLRPSFSVPMMISPIKLSIYRIGQPVIYYLYVHVIRHIMSRHVMVCYVMLCYIMMSCHAMSCHVMSCPWHVIQFVFHGTCKIYKLSHDMHISYMI